MYRTLSNAFVPSVVWSGAVLSFLLRCFAYLMTQVELCFSAEFSYFSQKSEPQFLT